MNWARDQSAGGGRINWVVAGRKITAASATKAVSGAASKTGADNIVWIFSPAWAVAQIEQV